jgi:hypothetical protein
VAVVTIAGDRHRRPARGALHDVGIGEGARAVLGDCSGSALALALALPVLYGLVRFVKWAWTGDAPGAR